MVTIEAFKEIFESGLIKELVSKKIKAGISGVNNKGLHVVSCGGFDAKEDAANLLASIRNDYPNAWVMAK